MTTRWYVPVLGAVVLLTAIVACGSDDASTSDPTGPTSTTTVPPLPTIGELVDGTVPADLMEEILDDAATVADVPLDQLDIVQANSVVWSDGSLGCPEPGYSYTQALVDGYQVVIKAAGTVLDYHASATGTFKLCPTGLTVPDPPDK